MKQVITILMFMSLSTVSAHASPNLLCSLQNIPQLKIKAEVNGSCDKFRHCAVSCMLSLRCSPTEVLAVGVLKEIADILTPDDSDLKDLIADYKGILQVKRKAAKSDLDCLTQCHQFYPEDQCP